MERKTNLRLPSFVWVGGETAKWPNAVEGGTVAAFLRLFGMIDPPKRKKFFSSGFASLMKHRGGTPVGKCGRSCTGGGASTRLGGMRPPDLCVIPLPHGLGRMRPRGEGPPSIRSGGLRWWSLRRMPPPLPRGKAPTSSPKPSKVATVAAQPPP